MLFAMANSGLPGTSGFVGEFMVILGSVRTNVWYAAAAATTLVFGAAYTLWMYKRVIFGAVANRHVAGLSDLNRREFLVLGCSRWRCSRWASGPIRSPRCCIPR
jgi:NADH-quinone oxidoreductase subunit M